MRRRILLLTGVLLLAGWFRLGYPGVVAFAFDEARLSLIALGAARGGVFPVVGMPSSAGVPNMPAAAWLFALPYAISPDPLVASLAVGVVGVLAVWGVWWLARPWGARAATVAALYLAVHPFAVLYGRSVWAQNLLVPLAVLWLICAVRATEPRSQRIAVGGAVFLSGFAFQVHFAGAALALAGAYAFLRWRWWRAPMPVIVGVVMALLCALPFALAPGAVAGLLNTAGGAASVDGAAWTDTVRLLAGYDWAYLLHGDAELPLARLSLTGLRAGLGVLLALGIGLGVLFGAAAWAGVDGKSDTDEAPTPPPETPQPTTSSAALPELALVLLVAAPLLFTRHSTPVFLHYLLTSLPAAALLLGWMTATARPAPLRHVVTALVVVGALVWGGGLARAFPYAGDVHTPNGLPEPLRTLRAAAVTPPTDRPVILFTHGDNPDVDGEAAVFRALWWPRGENARVIDGRSVLVLPDEPTTLLFTEQAFQSWEEARQSGIFTDTIPVPRRAGIAPLELAPYDGETAPDGFQMLPEPVRFAHGGDLLGWRVYTVGPRTRISTLWRASGPIGAGVQQFHHLYTGSTPDGPPDVVSDVSVRGSRWRDGDTVIVMGDFIDLPPDDEYTVRVGHYTLPDVSRIPTTDGADAVVLGAFRPVDAPDALE